jgi:hypothetical protein
LELAPQAVSIDLGTPPAGVEIAVTAATIELVAWPVTIQAPGAALLIGVPEPQTISATSLNYVDHDAATVSHAVDASSNPGAAEKLLKSSGSGYLQLVRLGIGKAPTQPLDVLGNIQLTGSLLHTADLTILATGGDVLFENTDIQAHNWTSGTTGWGIQHDGDADFRNITADSLTVEAFIADINLALAGSQIVTKSLGILSRSFAVPGSTATLYVYDLPGFDGAEVFEDGDYVRLRYIDRSGGGLVVGDAWGTVSSYTDLAAGEQSWTWTYVSGSIGQVIPEGGIALDYGTSGDGYWHVTTLDAAGSPYAEVGTWVTDPSDGANHTIHLRLGQLDGIAGIGDEWGLWTGQDTDHYLILSDVNFEAHGLRLSLYDSSSQEAIRLDPNAPYLAIGEPLPSGPDAGGDGLWAGQEGGSYKFRLGEAAGVALRWDGTNLKIRNSANADVIVLTGAGASYFAGPMTIGASGGIYQGTSTFSSPTTGLKIWNDSGIGRIGGYNAGTLQWYANTDGKLYAGGGNVVLDSTGIKVISDSGSSDPDPLNSIKFYESGFGTLIFKLGAAYPTGTRYGVMEAIGGGQNGQLSLKASTTSSSKTAIVELTADDTGVSAKTKTLSVRADSLYVDGLSVAPMHYLTTPLTSTSWDGDSKTSANNGTIDLSAVFGVPAGVTAVLVRLSARSTSVTDYGLLGPSSGQPNALVARTQVANIYIDTMGIVPCDGSGDMYFTASGTVLTIIEIWGYAL